MCAYVRVQVCTYEYVYRYLDIWSKWTCAGMCLGTLAYVWISVFAFYLSGFFSVFFPFLFDIFFCCCCFAIIRTLHGLHFKYFLVWYDSLMLWGCPCVVQKNKKNKKHTPRQMPWPVWPCWGSLPNVYFSSDCHQVLAWMELVGLFMKRVLRCDFAVSWHYVNCIKLSILTWYTGWMWIPPNKI